MQKGVIDIGSNTIVLNIYELKENIPIVTFHESNATHLVGYIENKVMKEEGILKACEVLKHYVSILKEKNIESYKAFITEPARNITNKEEDIEKENENVDRQIYIGGGGGAGGSGGINYDYVASYLTNQQKKIDEKIEKKKQKIKKRNYYIRKVYLEKLAKINENEIEYKKNLEQYENYSNDLQKIMTDIEKKNNIIKTNELQISKLEENHQNLLKIADAYNIINPDKQIKQKKTDKNKKDIFEETKKNLKKEKLEYKTTINKMIVRQKQNNKLIKELEEDFFNFKETLQEKKKALFFWKDKLYEIENELKNQSYLIKENENSIKSFTDKINDDIKNNSKVNENTPKKNNINKIKPLNKTWRRGT